MSRTLRFTSICLALASAFHGHGASATEPTSGLPTLHVSAFGGSDANPGTAQAPKATINGALAAATTTPAQVFVSDNIYNESIVLRSGVSLFGGFDPATWTRDPARETTIQSAAAVFTGNGLNQPLVVDRFTLRAGNASTPGASSYVVRLGTGSATVTFTRNRFEIGSGAAGSQGAAGAPGVNGQNGRSTAGTENRNGGAGGASPIGKPGGAGGNGGLGNGPEGPGLPGARGSAGAPGGTGGASGGCPLFGAGVGGDGQPGAEGVSGFFGTPGAALGTIAADYVAAKGGDGLDGSPGEGGGGGGGGGGDSGPGIECPGGDQEGGGGGGGGAGGQGGRGGAGGAGGGGAFGIYTFGTPVVVDRNRFDFAATADGPRGGTGGDGGDGGLRGVGGFAGAGASGDPLGGARGGSGGRGGNGGFGGPGAGGAGGPAISIVVATQNLLTVGTNRHTLPPAASGGMGGTNGTGGVARPGPTGIVARTHPQATSEPPNPALNVSDVSIVRDPAGGTILVPVTVTAPIDLPLGATFTIVAGSATSADIVPATGEVSLAPWDTQAFVPVTVLPAPAGTPARSFTVQLSSPVGAGLANASAVITLVSPVQFADGFEPAPAGR